MTMRKISFIAALVVAMTAVSCVKEMQTETPAPEVNGAVTFEASFGAATKAVLEPGATESKVAWEKGDQVGVFAGEGKFLYKAQNPGYSTTLATEAADVPAEGPYYAVYPYDAEAAVAEGVITTSLPAVQTAVLGSFTTHLSVAQAAENKFAFKNVCGLVGVKIDAENVTKIVLEGNNGEIVAGAINVTVADAPTWTAVAEQGAKSVTLAPAEGTLAKGVYYFAVLPQTFEKGFKVTAYKGEDASVVRNVASEFTLNRSDIIGSRAFGIDGSGTEADPYVLKTAQDMVDMRSLATVGGETWFRMANDIDLKGINWVPVNYDQNFERKIHFDGGNFTISNLVSKKSVHGADYPSFMGVVYGSIKNLKIDHAEIVSTSGCGVVGGYVGTSGKDGLVENVAVTNASVTNSGDRAGGICGTARQATFKNVSFQGTVTSTFVPTDSKNYARSGGFVGYTQTSASFEGCSVDVTFEGAGDYIGGFVGYITGTTTFKDCVGNKATVTSTYSGSQAKIGGFVGSADSGQTFTNCDAEVTVTVSSSDAGGFAGYLTGSQTFSDCDIKTTLISKGAEKNRCGGFIGWNNASNATTTITNCHVLEGSSITDESGRTANKNTNYGGFIGFGDNNGTALNISGCSANAIIDAGKFGIYNSCFIGAVSYKSTVTIENCFAVGEIKQAQNFSGGLIGAVGKTTTVSISGSHFNGTLAGASGVGGLVGGVEAGGVLNISKSYVEGTINPTGTNSAGIVGLISGPTTVENCWANVTVNMPKNQFGAGVAGGVTATLTVRNCYAEGLINVSRGCGSIVGQVKTAAPTVEGCIAWCQIKTSRAANQYSPGAVVGNIQVNGNFRNCYRKYDMDFTDVAMKLVDHENVENGRPPLPTYEGATADANQYAYHGKAAAAGSTISSVAKTIGWDENIWDLSGDVPVLK